MSDDESRDPIFSELPQDYSLIPNTTVCSCEHDAAGMLVAQNADDLFEISIQLFMSPDPHGCTAVMRLNAQGAREIGEHLLRLANFAEIGVPSDGNPS